MHYLSRDFVILHTIFAFIISGVVEAYDQNDPFHFPSQTYQQKSSNQLYQSPSRTSRGIPIQLAMKLNSITDEEELFEHFIENGPEIIHSSSSGPSRRMYGGVTRVGRVADVRHYTTRRDTEIEPISFSSIGSLPRSNRLGSNAVDLKSGFSTNHQDLDESPIKVSLDYSAPKTPRAAVCEPELRTVNLRDLDDPTLFYHQSCTRVKRCGGCCSHDLLSCQPKAIKYTNYTVNVSRYTGKDKLKFWQRRIITVEEHLNCTCACKIKAQDCTSRQKYEKENCRCVCTNQDAEERCETEHDLKLWDQPSCSCRCRDDIECSSGYTFDETTCKCIPAQAQNFLPEYTIDNGRYQGAYGPYQ